MAFFKCRVPRVVGHTVRRGGQGATRTLRVLVVVGLAGCSEGSQTGRLGAVSFSSYPGTAMHAGGWIVGAFYDDPDGAHDTSACAKQTFGACQSQKCPLAFYRTTPPLDAGTLTIGGPHQAITLSRSAEGIYTWGVQNQDAPPWDAGVTLTVTASGAEVPAFTGSVVAPAPIDMNTPAFPQQPQSSISVPSGGDLAFSWTGGGDGFVTVRVMHAELKSIDRLECSFPAREGRGTISSSALRSLGAPPLRMTLGSNNSGDIEAGDWRVSVTASTTIYQADHWVGGSLAFIPDDVPEWQIVLE